MDHKLKAPESLHNLHRLTVPVLQMSLTLTFLVLMNNTKAVGNTYTQHIYIIYTLYILYIYIMYTYILHRRREMHRLYEI